MTSCGVVDPQYKFLIEELVVIEKSNVSYTISGNRNEEKRVLNCLQRVENKKIKNNCKIPCVSHKFDFTISHLRWPVLEEAEEHLQKFKISQPQARNWTLEDIYKNLLKVQIYFSEFDVDEIEQRLAYTWDMVPSDLGGLIGLYIGASVYSVLEVFSFIFSLIYYCYQTAGRRTSVKSDESENL